MQLRGPLVAALVFFAPAGCTPPCETATCVGEEAVAAWPTDPAAVTARVRALPDEFTRAAVVGALCEAYPGATGALCEALPPGPGKDRCERLNNRPHLSVVPGGAAVGSASAGDVPRDRPGSAPGAEQGPPPEASFPAAILPMPPAADVPDGCAESPDRGACLDAAALEAALDGDAGAANAVCGRHTEPRWADECRFAAAEGAVRKRRGSAYEEAATLCGAATRFAQECWSHVLTRLPRTIPPSNAGAPRAKAAIDLAAKIRATWAPVDAAAADVHTDRFWALYFVNVYRHSDDPDGTPLTVYPEETWPHIRAAATARLHALGRLEGPFDAQLRALRAALARVSIGTAARSELPDLVFVQRLGDPVTAGPSTFFLGAARRARGADADQDLRLCLLESAARVEAHVALVAEAATGPDPVVAAEARRLQRALAER
jgi:hypothetical protein